MLADLVAHEPPPGGGSGAVQQLLVRGTGQQATGFADRYAVARPLAFSATSNKLNHGVFRYPAKFHPLIARRLVELISREGETILDPFCGSGTLLVEAAAIGRGAVQLVLRSRLIDCL